LKCGPSVVCVLVLGALAQSGIAYAAAERPNVLLVVVDDLRFDDLGAAGHPFARTPNIDRLAREGALFKNAFAVTPLCSPSRANILTGLYTRHHGILDNTERGPRSHELATVGQALQRAGYDTGFVGKWHMGNDPTPRPGFRYWSAMKGQGEAVDPQLFEDGRLQAHSGYVTDVLTEKALRFLGEKREGPFFLMLAHKALHPNIVQHADGSTTAIGEGGFIPAERHKGLFAGLPIPRRANYAVPPRGKPALERRFPGLPPLGPETVTPDETVRDRLRMLVGVDEGLGRLLSALEERGALARTIVLLMGDNGYFYGEHGLAEERRLAYEESIRLPLLVRYPPAVPAGRQPTEMALSIDVAPTLLDLAGAPPLPAVDGRSLVPVLAGPAKDWRRSCLIEYTTDIVFPRIRNMGYDAVRTERHKWVRYRELPGMDELYDLERDPFELENLAGRPDSAELLERMEAELRALLAPKTPEARQASPERPNRRRR
jgi:N-acetylglucosamine-6-sulfatase